MAVFKGSAIAVLAALVLAFPAAGQQPAQIALIEGDAPGDYRAAGVVMAETLSTTNTLPKQKLDEQLRAEAAKLRADAIIHVTYQMTPSATVTMYRASGVAIRYADAPAPAAPAPPPAEPVAPPAVPAAPAASVAPVAATAPPVVTPVSSPNASPAAAVAAPAAAALPVVHAASAAQVELNESSMQGRRFARLGPVSVTTHPTSMMMKITPKEQAQEALRAAAFKLGADAVIEVKYVMVNSAFTRKGNTASGIAVRFE